jgi:hypothetical protein
VPDTKNRVEISNGEETFTLIGGELTTDDDGNVVDRGKTNLVVARNSEGDLVLLPSTDKLTILPNSQTLEDFGNQLYQELGANATEAIDPNNDLVQSQAEAATEQMQPAVEATNDEEVNPSEEATQEEQNVEGAPITEGETPTNGVAQPVSEETQPVSEEAEPQQEETKPVIPTDKDGVKLYENGIDAGDALGDMLENGDNPIEIADAAIAEADEAINAINSKKTKRRKDLVVRKKHEQTKKYYEDLKSKHTHVDLGNGYSSELYGDNRGFILKD